MLDVLRVDVRQESLAHILFNEEDKIIENRPLSFKSG